MTKGIDERTRILILGGGFAGAFTAKCLEKKLFAHADAEVMLVAQEDFLLFTPMLHEVTASEVEVTAIVQSLRKMLPRTQILVGKIDAVELDRIPCQHVAVCLARQRPRPNSFEKIPYYSTFP